MGAGAALYTGQRIPHEKHEGETGWPDKGRGRISAAGPAAGLRRGMGAGRAVRSARLPRAGRTERGGELRRRDAPVDGRTGPGTARGVRHPRGAAGDRRTRGTAERRIMGGAGPRFNAGVSSDNGGTAALGTTGGSAARAAHRFDAGGGGARKVECVLGRAADRAGLRGVWIFRAKRRRSGAIGPPSTPAAAR